jgi:hypothetical protein
MDIKQLLEKMDQFAGQAVGQKPGDQWKGTDKAPPGKKLVGDSILKDLSKGKTPKSKEQELSEEFEAFLQSLEEENLGTHPKRPGRTSDRHARGHEPLPRYKTVKEIDAPEIEFQKQQALRKHEDETAEVGMFTGAETGFGALSAARSARKRAKAKDDDEIDESAMSEKDIELQDYRSMTDKEFQTAYGMSKTEWINKNKSLVIQNPSIKKALGLDEAGSPAQQAAIAIAMKKAGKKPKNESAEQEYTVIIDRKGREKPVSGTIPELLQYFGYTLEVGKSYEHERGRYKINMNPKNVVQLVDALNKAATNAAANSSPSTYYSVGEGQVVEGVAYKAANPHPASKDPIVAKVLKQMRPGLTGLDMNNEAFLYFAYEIGKMRAREMWVDYGPAIKHFYQSGIGVNEDANTDNKLAKLLTRFINQNEGTAYKTANPHPASKDPIVASVLKQMRPGLTGIDMNNEAFLYFAYELGKQRARDAWSDYLPAIRSAYEQGLNESADLKKQADKYTELALKANKAGDEEKCKAFQKKVADIKNKMSKLEEESLSDIDIEHQDYKTMTDLEFKRAYNISKTDWFNKYKSLLIQRPDIKKALKIDENSVTHLRDREDLQAKQKALQDLQLDVNTHKDPELSSAVANRMDILMKQAKKLGIDESRAHEVLNTWFKNREIAQRAADQSPEERAEAEKKHAEQMKKDQQEYLKNNPNSIFKPMDEDSSVPTTPGTPTTPTTPTTGTPTTNTSGNQANTAMLATTTTSTDPAVKAAAAKAATGLNALKSAVGGQVNPQKMADTINKISTNKPVNQNDLKSIAPIVSTIGKAVTNPTDANKISSDLRTIFQQFKKNS